jgi:hypothetical protein
MKALGEKNGEKTLQPGTPMMKVAPAYTGATGLKVSFSNSLSTLSANPIRTPVELHNYEEARRQKPEEMRLATTKL